MFCDVLRDRIVNKELDSVLVDLYADENVLEYQRDRFVGIVDRFVELYGCLDVRVFSAAGRSEVGGNHTDHQHGCVLAASINLDAVAVVSLQEDVVSIVSDDMVLADVNVNDLEHNEEDFGTSEGLVRGVLFKLREEGFKIGGFKAFISSDVLMGAGLSSSAAFETLIGTIVSGLYNDMQIDMVEIAKVGQFAENVYFGKPCGLMDQCACAVGGLINIDFNDPKHPVVRHLDVDFGKFNHSLCIVDTKGSHADLTDEYAAIPADMKCVAAYFGKEFLRDVDASDFFSSLASLRDVCSDRAILRAMHFFDENDRVQKLVDCLNVDDFDGFKSLIQASGNSSYKFLQNVYASCDPLNQAVSLGLALSEHVLQDHGVCRVHGGGFAGTIQAFVEDSFVQEYKEQMELLFGVGSCHVLKVRKYGGCAVFD